MKPTSGINEYQIMTVFSGKVYTCLGNLDRIALTDLEHRNAELRATTLSCSIAAGR